MQVRVWFIDSVRRGRNLSTGAVCPDTTEKAGNSAFVSVLGQLTRDAPAVYGPHKTLYNRWFRWSQMGIFGRILMELVREDAETEMIMIDATHLKAHRTASSLRKKGGALG